MNSKQAIFETIVDQSDAIPLCPRLNLFLKPFARILITVQLDGKTKTTISNWQIMERLKEWIDPDKFSHLCVAKTTSELIRFDAELADRSRLSIVLSRLCDRRIKFPGFSYLLTVRAIESEPDFPTRHNWDSYFRDSKDMNELKPGERPDTLHIENLPLEWLTEAGEKYPSENILKKIFNGFGEVARVDLPAADPSRVIHGVGICDAYIQFRDYSAFAKAMNALRGNKLALITDTKALTANIKVDFDKTKHMTLSAITKRHERRDRFLMRKKVIEETERLEKAKELKKREEENKKKLFELEKKNERRKLREEKRKAKRIKRLAEREADVMNQKIATEERLLLKTQRKLEAIHLLGELFTRIKSKINLKSNEEEKSEKNNANTNNVQCRDIESTFRQRMIEKWKPSQHKILKNSSNNNDSENRSYNNDQNNRGRGRGIWRGNRGKGTHQYIGRGPYLLPPIFDPMQLINYGHKYHKYIQKLNKKTDNDRSRSRSRSRKRRRSFSSRSSRSYSRSRSRSRNKSYSRSRSRSCTKISNSRSRSRSKSKSPKKTHKSHSESKSRSRSIDKSSEKTIENRSKHKHKKKSKNKKSKKPKKSKK
ncbi:A-kinase anchor protein 17A isoform X1 [Acyrthosiphon pisum]|uniref:RRM domain-containing protein n=2 Tax=Acyrthosiphon pisum TaxID=7029 RepID=A0A8R2NMU1_ACYPI|nr:A-kinase anchor protein 17A isoform X1 [Acyrthosiphon pisum]|eukprot:XP_001947990.1 PREDICTED: A-kinase anchor protein 17A isoform X1 [Acyrthosiphon pisum]